MKEFKNNSKIIIVALIILAVGLFSYYSLRDESSLEDNGVMEKKGVGELSLENGVMMEKEGYSGNILAGSEIIPYLEFNREDYEKALSQDKIILLYFYASWCPTCRAEQPEIFAAFNELNNNNLIGFRVNYKDSATNEDEENLAEEFGIPYQHTKVIISKGMQALKSLEGWDKRRYLDELNKFS